MSYYPQGQKLAGLFNITLALANDCKGSGGYSDLIRDGLAIC